MLISLNMIFLLAFSNYDIKYIHCIVIVIVWVCVREIHMHHTNNSAHLHVLSYYVVRSLHWPQHSALCTVCSHNRYYLLITPMLWPSGWIISVLTLWRPQCQHNLYYESCATMHINLPAYMINKKDGYVSIRT